MTTHQRPYIKIKKKIFFLIKSKHKELIHFASSFNENSVFLCIMLNNKQSREEEEEEDKKNHS